jgi:hypothetical protein
MQSFTEIANDLCGSLSAEARRVDNKFAAIFAVRLTGKRRQSRLHCWSQSASPRVLIILDWEVSS